MVQSSVYRLQTLTSAMQGIAQIWRCSMLFHYLPPPSQTNLCQWCWRKLFPCSDTDTHQFLFQALSEPVKTLWWLQVAVVTEIFLLSGGAFLLVLSLDHCSSADGGVTVVVLYWSTCVRRGLSLIPGQVENVTAPGFTGGKPAKIVRGFVLSTEILVRAGVRHTAAQQFWSSCWYTIISWLALLAMRC